MIADFYYDTPSPKASFALRSSDELLRGLARKMTITKKKNSVRLRVLRGEKLIIK